MTPTVTVQVVKNGYMVTYTSPDAVSQQTSPGMPPGMPPGVMMPGMNRFKETNLIALDEMEIVDILKSIKAAISQSAT